jgi:hypothetical protein
MTSKKKIPKKITKGKEEKVLEKKQFKKQEKLLKIILITLGVIIILVVASSIYLKSLRSSSYGEIEFRTVNMGTNQNPLIMHETLTLAISNDGSKEQFGFRIRTKPSKLKRISFDAENFDLMKVNGYWYEDEFNCEGDAIIAMENLKRLFKKTGMDFVRDNESTCDPEGRYNYFILKYGEKTQIKEVGNRCYEIIIEGDEDSCEILQATEKLMVEVFNRYISI